MYQHYQWILWIRFTFLAISLISYIILLALILYSKIDRTFSGKLTISMTISQYFIIIPIFIIPYFTNPNGKTSQPDIIRQQSLCEVDGIMILFGWFTATLFSILDCYIVITALQGKIFKLGDQWKWILSIYIVGLLFIIPIYFFGDIKIKKIGIDSNNQNIYAYCNPSNNYVIIILYILDILSILLMVLFWFRKRSVLKTFMDASCIIDQEIVKIHYISFAQIIPWTANLIFKTFIQYFESLSSSTTFISINQIYYLEGLFMLITVMKLYQTKLINILPSYINIYQCKCCKNQSNIDVLIIEDYNQDYSSDQSN